MLSLERVNNQNTLHKCVNQIEIDLLELLSPYLNQKIMTVKGEKSAKFKHKFNDFIESHGYNQSGSGVLVNIFIRYNSLILSVRNSQIYLNDGVYVGRCNDDGILIELKPHVPLRTDYTLTEVENAFKTARELEERARILLSSVSVFSR